MRVAVVVPNRDGRRWLPGLFASLGAQTRPPDDVVVVDDASADDPADLLPAGARLVRRSAPGGFGAAVNAGVRAADGADAVAVLNTDVELASDWLERMARALEEHPGAGAVACKMVRLDDPAVVDDAGDALRRDGVCEQRGRGRRDEGRWDAAGEVWGACAGAALYRRSALLDAGGFDERFVMYLEDVELALRLRRAGWTCRYEPAVARHAGGGSGATAAYWAARNTILLVAKAFPWRWAPYVAYRQAAWLADAARRRRLRVHLRGLAAAVPLVPAMWRDRGAARALPVPVAAAVPARPWRGPRAGGHPESPE